MIDQPQVVLPPHKRVSALAHEGAEQLKGTVAIRTSGLDGIRQAVVPGSTQGLRVVGLVSSIFGGLVAAVAVVGARLLASAPAMLLLLLLRCLLLLLLFQLFVEGGPSTADALTLPIASPLLARS